MMNDVMVTVPVSGWNPGPESQVKERVQANPPAAVASRLMVRLGLSMVVEPV